MAAPELSPQERRHAQTSERIRSAAVRLFRDNGYEGTSVADIADAADISERTLFRYFRAKEDILFGKPESLIPMAQQVVTDLDRGLSDWEALQIALRSYGASMQAREREVRPAVDLIHTVPELHARRTLMQERWAEAIAAALAQRRGQDEAGFDDLALAGAGFAIYGAAVRRWLTDSDLILPDLIDEAFQRFDNALGVAAAPH